MSSQRDTRFQNMSSLLRPADYAPADDVVIADERPPQERANASKRRQTKPAAMTQQAARSISFTMSPELRNQFRRLAKESGLSQSDFFLRIMEDTIGRVAEPLPAVGRPGRIFQGLTPARDRSTDGDHVVLTVRIGDADQKTFNKIITEAGIANRSRYVRLALAEHFRNHHSGT